MMMGDGGFASRLSGAPGQALIAVSENTPMQRGVDIMAIGKGPESAVIGTWVRVVEHGSGEEDVFYLVESREADYLENKIPPESPMSRALLGSKAGDDIAVDGPNGPVRFSVCEVGRP
jgi:transcription elongation GreA/GreB family factor